MNRYWQSLVRPACEVVRPETVVFIGDAASEIATNVLDFCRQSGARVELVDPRPTASEEELDSLRWSIRSFGNLHLAPSHDVLPGITGDVFLIDDDDNWFTIHRDLVLIEETAQAAGRVMPLIFVHDVAWPYGRRDHYPDPESIPSDFRRPHARGGILFGSSELRTHGGIHADRAHAIEEGGERNGVLTGVDDYIGVSGRGWKRFLFPEFHGMAVLFDPASYPARYVRAELESLCTLTPNARVQLEMVEAERLAATTDLADSYARLGGRPGKQLARLVRTVKRVLGR